MDIARGLIKFLAARGGRLLLVFVAGRPHQCCPLWFRPLPSGPGHRRRRLFLLAPPVFGHLPVGRRARSRDVRDRGAVLALLITEFLCMPPAEKTSDGQPTGEGRQVRLSVIAASVSSWPWMRIHTCCWAPWSSTSGLPRTDRSTRQPGSTRPKPGRTASRRRCARSPATGR